MALLAPLARLPARLPLRSALFGRSPVGRPSLRGISHQYAFLLSVLAAVVLAWMASNGQQLLGVVLYCGTVSAMLATSAIYHRVPWPDRWHRHFRRADHCMIYLSMAGSYAGLWLLVLPHGPATDTVLVAVVPLTTLGILFKLTWLDAPRWLSSSTYVAMGLVGIVTIPALVSGAGAWGATLYLAGAFLQLTGVTIFTAQWPDPLPDHFGHHEIFHLLVVLGIAAQYGVLALALS